MVMSLIGTSSLNFNSMQHKLVSWIFFPVLAGLASVCIAQTKPEAIVHSGMLHVRASSDREWTSFSAQADASSLDRRFESRHNDSPWTLSLRQVDIKQSWQVRINDQVLGRLVQDENDLISDFRIPPGALRDGENRLQISQTGRDDADDIRLGEIRLYSVSPLQLREESTVIVDLTDQNRTPLPGRITIVDSRGVLTPVAAQENEHLAVREGVVYTSSGSASFGVGAGTYRIYGSRGFEYSAPSITFSVKPGMTLKRTLILDRVVDTSGWVACDTHVHTVTHSGHGDCTLQERMATLAGEAVELVMATDHNKQIDYRPIAKQLNVEKYFTPVIGNEVTTKQGHFNIWPINRSAAVPDHNTSDWPTLFRGIYATPNVKVAILNHARDIHAGFRPFAPRHHISVSGENLDQRELRANAMEVINSGAVQTDPMELFRDWCGLLNRGQRFTPVGSSDSHDVARYIVGQGRTYIRCDDQDPGKIDIDAATAAFMRGSVIVGYGLLTTITVNDQYGPGDLARLDDATGPVEIMARVLGPNWAHCREIELYVNGRERFSHVVTSKKRETPGLISEVSWQIPRRELTHDVWLTIVARGPGIRGPFWKTAKPYQPDSPAFRPYTFSCTGPVLVDVDGDGSFSSAHDYAQAIVDASSNDGGSIPEKLASHDHSVAVQVASLLTAAQTDLNSDEFRQLLKSSPEHVQAAFAEYRRAWRESQKAIVEARE
jgi:hypothetical protein